jgi:hypothetical protein
MRALIVYESMFGTNRTVATALADGIGPPWETEVLEVGHAPVVIGPDVDLLVVGGPNHQFGLPRPSSRVMAAAELAEDTVVSPGPGLREWLTELVIESHGQPVAVWETRMAAPKALHLVDRSARSIARRLERAGAHLVIAPEHFEVRDMQGPLLEGEEAHARRFGQQLAAAIVPA